MRLLSTFQAAKKLRVDKSLVRRWCATGRIAATRVGRAYVIAEDDLERFAAVQRIPGRPPRI